MKHIKQIKFKAWRDGKMYGPSKLEELLVLSGETGFSMSTPTPVEWLQNIGVYDKNAVEIYEGDWLLITDPNGERLEPQCVFYDDQGGYFIEDDDLYPIGYAISQGYEVEIIGNKFKVDAVDIQRR